MPTGEWSFHCTACGKCCNSAPELTVPELFHHERRFVGRLAIRRVRRHPAGRASGTPSDWFLFTHARNDDALGRCPALAEDGRCLIHADRKPVACAVVPLDALAPDSDQHAILARRATEASYLGASCLVPSPRAGYTPLVRHLTVVDPTARAALGRRRDALSLEKQRWGNAVFRLLERELFSNDAALAKIPEDGFMSLSLAPVLMVLAEVSPGCRARCVRYLDAQLELCRTLELTDELRVHTALRHALADDARGPRASAREAYATEAYATEANATEASATEAWLGLGAAA